MPRDTTLFDTGGRYDPSVDVWQPTSAGSGVPSARSYHSAIWTGSEMIVWGGSTGLSTSTNGGGRYVPVADAWSATSASGDVPAERSLHTAVWSR